MPIAVSCPDCGKAYELPDESLGRKANCKSCGNTFRVHTGDDTSQSNRSVREGVFGFKSRISASDTLPAQIGRFQILAKLGAGAFGTVYKAYDPVLERDVAVKVPNPGLLSSERDKQRYLREPKAAGQLHHPNIVPVFEASLDGDNIFIVSAFIKGRTLEKAIEEKRPDLRRAATLVMKLGRALQYAHENGIVHRDVKPANIMLDAKGEPLLMDFGLARIQESAEKLTMNEAVLGTPAYMSPEQASHNNNDVGPASDQYSLGVILFEMLCGQRPFSGPAAIVISLVIKQEPPGPRSLNPKLPQDLETICLKAMAKEPKKRFADCQELADDLERWLQDEPILARRTTFLERSVRWTRRNPLVAGLTIAVLAVSGIGFLVSSSALAFSWVKEQQARNSAKIARESAEEAKRQEVEAKKQEQRAAISLKQAEVNLKDAESSKREAFTQAASASLLKAIDICEQGDVAWGLLELSRSLDFAEKAKDEALIEAVQMNLTAWRPSASQLERMLQHPTLATTLVVSEDGDKLIVGTASGAVYVWSHKADFANPKVLQHPQSISGLGIWKGTSRLVTACTDNQFRVWDFEKGTVLKTGRLDGAGQLSCDPKSTRFAVGNWGGATVYDGNSGEKVKSLIKGACEAVAFMPDGQLATLDNGTRLQIWAAEGLTETGTPIRTSESDGVRSISIAISQNATLVGAGHLLDPAAVLIQMPAKEIISRVHHTGTISSLSFSTDSRFFVSGSEHGVIKFYDTVLRKEVPSWLRTFSQVSSMAFFPGKYRFATSAGETSVRIWKMPVEPRRHTLANLNRVLSVQYSPNGKLLASAAGYYQPQLRIWNAATGVLEVDTRPTQGNARAIAFAPDGRSAYVTTCDTPSGTNLYRWNLTSSPPEDLMATYHNQIWRLELTPDGESLCVGAWGRNPGIFSVSSRKFRDLPQVHRDWTLGVSINKDGTQFLTGSHDRTIRFWNVKDSTPRTDFIQQPTGIYSSTFHPSGKSYFLGGLDGVIRQYDLLTHQQNGPSMRHLAVVHWLKFTPDGKLLVSGSADGTARLWHPPSGQPVGPVMRHNYAILSLGVSPTGEQLATGDERGTIHTWTLPDLSKPVSDDARKDTEILTGATLDDELGVRILNFDEWSSRRRKQ